MVQIVGQGSAGTNPPPRFLLFQSEHNPETVYGEEAHPMKVIQILLAIQQSLFQTATEESEYGTNAH